MVSSPAILPASLLGSVDRRCRHTCSSADAVTGEACRCLRPCFGGCGGTGTEGVLGLAVWKRQASQPLSKAHRSATLWIQKGSAAVRASSRAEASLQALCRKWPSVALHHPCACQHSKWNTTEATFSATSDVCRAQCLKTLDLCFRAAIVEGRAALPAAVWLPGCAKRACCLSSSPIFTTLVDAQA